MRIIAGEKRGLKLVTRDGLETRPTADRVKEAIFGRLQFELQGACVLDLFAGSGALGIEALSRGAQKAVFIDDDTCAEEAIKQNIALAEMEDRATFIKIDYRNALKLFQNKKKFDIVFLDPPYHSGFYETVLQELVEKELLENRAIVVSESAKPIIKSTGLMTEKEKRYGKTFVTFFRWEEE